MAFEISDEYTLEVLFTPSECEALLALADSFTPSVAAGDINVSTGTECRINVEALNALLESKGLPAAEWAMIEKFNVNQSRGTRSECTAEEMTTFKSVWIFLNNPDQYAGGDFYIREDAIDRSQGNVLHKQSWLRNSVGNVEAGEVNYLVYTYTM